MTVVDTSPDVTTAPAVETPALSQGQLDMMRAFFCYEFEVAKLDRSSLPEATPDVVTEWIQALTMSGLFAPTELRTMSQAWLSEPDALVSLLVGDIDEVAARRDVTAAVPTTEAVTVDTEAVTVDTDFLRAS